MPNCERSSKTFQLSSLKTRTGDGSSGQWQCALLMRQQTDGNGLPCAIGTKDGGVLARTDLQRQSMKDGRITFLDAGID